MARKSAKRKRSRKAASAQAERQSSSTQPQPRAKEKPPDTEEADRVSRPTITAFALPRPVALTGWIVAIVAVAFFYLVLKMFAMNAYAGDEHIYLYQAKLVSEGTVPYSDFAMAHPPLQTVFTAIIFKIFGYHFLLGRLLPVLWCLCGGLILGVMVFRELGALASIASTTLYLLSYEPLRASSHYTGVNMAVALLIAGVFALRSGAVRIAAALCVAAVFTRLYAIPGVLVLVGFALFVTPKQGLRFAKYSAGIGASVFFLIGFWTGFADFLDNTFFYHAYKTAMAKGALASMRDGVMFHNATITLLFILAQIALLVAVDSGYQKTDKRLGFIRRIREVLAEKGTGLLVLSSATAVFLLLILLNMNRVWMYYFIPAFPFAAVPAGWLVARWLAAGLQLIRARGNLAQSNLSRADFAGGLVLLVVAVAGLLFSPNLEKRLGYYQRAMKKPPSARAHQYEWNSGLLPDAINQWVRSTLWPKERVIGERYNSFNYLLWHESRTFGPLEEMVATIRGAGSSTGEIFGDSGTVPLLALQSGRRIAANQVDTNIQRYRSGSTDADAVIKEIDNEKTELIILRHRFGVAGLKQVKQLVREKYTLVKSFRDSKKRALYRIYKRDE